jgi:hypothetical protein
VRRIPKLLPYVFLALGLSALAFFLCPQKEARLWKGYRVLLVERSVPERLVLTALGTAHINDVLSESTQPFDLSDFSQVTTTTLAAAQSRLIDADPRRDSYLLGLASWFSARQGDKAYRIFYVKQGPWFPSEGKLRQALSGFSSSCLLPESNSESPPLFISVVVLLVALSLVFFMPKRPRLRVTFIAALLPWLLLGFRNGDAVILTALWAGCLGVLSPAAQWALDEYSYSGDIRKAIRRFLNEGLPAGFLLIPAVGWLGVAPSLAMSTLLCLIASLLAVIAANAIFDLADREGRAFIPVRIGSIRLKARYVWTGDRRLFSAASCLCIVALACGLGADLLQDKAQAGNPATNQGPEALFLPQAIALRGHLRPGPKEVKSRLEQKDDGRLVDLSDWLVHRWWEESLFYAPLDQGTVEIFAQSAIANPHSATIVLKSYDEAWAAAAYRSMSATGIERLWLGAGRPIGGRMQAFAASSDGPLAPIEALLYIILMIPPCIGVLLLHGGLRHRERK